MIRRWMSDVPSSISSSLASRIHFSTGYSGSSPSRRASARPPTCTTSPSPRRELGHRRLQRHALAGVDPARGPVDEQARGVDPGGHVGEAEGDRLVLGDRLAELLPRLRVLDGVLERGPRDPGGGGAQRDARAVERAHEPVEALPFVAEPAVLWAAPRPRGTSPCSRSRAGHLLHRLAERDAEVAPSRRRTR